MVHASDGPGPYAKKARPSSVDDVILSQESGAAAKAGPKGGRPQGPKGMMLTLAEVRPDAPWGVLNPHDRKRWAPCMRTC